MFELQHRLGALLATAALAISAAATVASGAAPNGTARIGTARINSAQDGDPPGASVQLSSSCARCHSAAPGASALRDADGETVAPYDLWRGTMMANSALDPLWRAVVSVEVAATPSARAAIESKCLSCHAPMADQVGIDVPDGASPIAVLHDEGMLGELARDGVSCTICHGIAPDRLGTAASFSAGFVLDPWNRLYGPHEDPFQNPMNRATGFFPTHGAHILDSALCGSCHTLETDALRPDGTPTGHVLLEQAPYIEWRNSVFDTERAEPGPNAANCQDCHVPTTNADGSAIETRIARNPGGSDFPFTTPRRPVGRHVFVGGNTLVLGLFEEHGEALGATAPREAFTATRAATFEQLEERTAAVEIVRAEREGDRLTVEVRVQNRTGHKLPTAHPTRRAFLRATVTGADGATLFASGATDDAGRLVDAAGEILPSEVAGGPIAPHRDVVRAPDEVVEYRAVMADEHGAPTHLLMRGATWLSDTRLLPRGWSAEHPDAERTRPIGTEDDANFSAGEDTVTYSIDLAGRRAAAVEIELCYQTLAPRWADEMRRYDTPEVARFMQMYEDADRAPVVLAAARVEL
ncbi:hypothetical protein Pla163_16100 [Planctomycetes bacterium Pla163]|uniref:Cytochrome c-552/4 domain-containing protein n=1 Tax=Rohdeia mirabilis TaxID=2528008 RepID=A0A518CZ40_9BACT|nr:hypothetical protein Pla163_16100 [Planctomycetes bacterium Pla163]